MSDSGWRRVITENGDILFINLHNANTVEPDNNDFTGSAAVIKFGGRTLAVLNTPNAVIGGKDAIQSLREHQAREES